MIFKSSRRGSYKQGKYALSVKERISRDFILANNPVLVTGLGLAPVIIAATSLRNSLVISIMMTIIIISVRTLGNFTIGYIGNTIRIPLYALMSSVMFIPAYLLAQQLFPFDVARLDRFLPLIVLDSIIMAAAESDKREKFNDSVRNSVFISIGFSFAVCLIGLIREFFGEARIFGLFLPGMPVLFPILKTTVGGFMTLAIISGFFQILVSSVKRSAYKEEREV